MHAPANGTRANDRLLAALAWSCLALGAQAQVGRPADYVPETARDTGVTQRVGESLPLELEFVNTRGERIALADLFGRGKPVLLTFNYSDCPQLCTLQLNGLVQALREVQYTVGEEFEVATISIDPSETTERAGLTQARYFADYLRASEALTDKGRRRTQERAAELRGDTEAGPGDGTAAERFAWHFLTGDEDSIRAAADAVGYAYRLDPNTGEYAHDAVVVVLTPDGTISRYLPSVFYEPRDLELALLSASNGELGGIVAWTRMFCYRWDPEAGTYVRSAERLMLLGAGGSALVLLAFLGFMWRREWRGRGHGGGDAALAGGAPAR